MVSRSESLYWLVVWRRKKLLAGHWGGRRVE